MTAIDKTNGHTYLLRFGMKAPAVRRAKPRGEVLPATELWSRETKPDPTPFEAVHGNADSRGKSRLLERFEMVMSLSARSVESFKSEARVLREDRAAKGEPLSQSQALEAVAREHGYRDWNTARADLPEHLRPTLQVGQRVSGHYLSQPFEGVVLGLAMLGAGKYFRVKIRFDEPVDVVKFDSFSAFRQQVQVKVDAYGRSPDHTSDGKPHLQLDLRKTR